MGSFSVAERNKWLTDFTSVTSYIALYVGDPMSGGTELPFTGGYARKAIPGSAWGPVFNGTIANDEAIDFAKATNNWNDGNNITHFALMDSPTGSTIRASDDLPVGGKPVMINDTASFSVGDLAFSIT